MSLPATRQQLTYDLHGIGLAVSCPNPAVTEAIELRLQGFRRNTAQPAEISLEFLIAEASGDGRLTAPPGASRPVYDTPYGELHYFPNADTLWGVVEGVRLRCEAGNGVARLESAAFAGRELYLATHALATISLMELLERRGRYCLHAGCVAASDGRGVLLAGPTGAGKSTLTIALARAGLAYLSDDIVFLDHGQGADTVRVLGFPDALGVTAQTAQRFEELRAFATEEQPSGFPKHLTRMEAVFDVRTLPSCTPAVLIFPEIVRGQSSRLRPLDPKQAWLRLVPDVLLTHPEATQAHLRAIAALLAEVNCFELQSGADVDATAQLILRDAL
jgi:hypothetical protein